MAAAAFAQLLLIIFYPVSFIIVADCRFNFIGGYQSVTVNAEQCYFKALLFKLFKGMQYGMMLKSRRNNMTLVPGFAYCRNGKIA